MPDRRQLLILVLRGSGSILLLAFLASLLPISWMRAVHDQLGIGSFPQSPLVAYLTRSVALLYGFHGVLVWISSLDVDRFRPIIYFNGTMNILFGTSMLIIDVTSGMPLLWTLGEGPGIAGVGVVILSLAYRRSARISSVPQPREGVEPARDRKARIGATG